MSIKFLEPGIAMSYKDIGKELGVSAERAKQICNKALEKLSYWAILREMYKDNDFITATFDSHSFSQPRTARRKRAE